MNKNNINPHILATDKFLAQIQQYIHNSIRAYMGKHKLSSAIIIAGRPWCDGDPTELRINAYVSTRPFENEEAYNEWDYDSDINIPIEFGYPEENIEFYKDVYTLYPLFTLLCPDPYSGKNISYYYKEDGLIPLDIEAKYREDSLPYEYIKYSQGKYAQAIY